MKTKIYKDGKPCSSICLKYKNLPCPICGRIRAKGIAELVDLDNPLREESYRAGR